MYKSFTSVIVFATRTVINSAVSITCNVFTSPQVFGVFINSVIPQQDGAQALLKNGYWKNPDTGKEFFRVNADFNGEYKDKLGKAHVLLVFDIDTYDTKLDATVFADKAALLDHAYTAVGDDYGLYDGDCDFEDTDNMNLMEQVDDVWKELEPILNTAGAVYTDVDTQYARFECDLH